MTIIKVQHRMAERFRHNLKRIREKQKLSRTALALISGVNREYLAQLERGQRNPSTDMIELLARSLDVDPAVLMKEI